VTQEVQTPVKNPVQLREARIEGRISAVEQFMRDSEARLGVVIQANQADVMKAVSALLTNVYDIAQMTFQERKENEKLRQDVAELKEQNEAILADLARLRDMISDGSWEEAEIIARTEEPEAKPISESHANRVERALNDIFHTKEPFFDSGMLYFDSLSLQMLLADICTDFEGEKFGSSHVQPHFNRVTARHKLEKFSARGITESLKRYSAISERLGFKIIRFEDEKNARFTIVRT
jgi:regulator of replication initiation timing